MRILLILLKKDSAAFFAAVDSSFMKTVGNRFSKSLHLIAIGLLFLAGVSRAADEQEIDSLLWDATASNSADRAMLAFDHDPTTRWDTGGSQQVGQWFQIDLGETRSVSRLTLDTSGSPGDYPRQYELTVSM